MILENTPVFIIILCLTAVTAIHLTDCFRDDERRNRSKPFLLLLILAYYLAAVDEPGDISAFLVAALFTSWVGDVLLIPAGNKWFTAGGIAFMMSHFCFIGSFAVMIDFANVNYVAVIPLAVVYFGVAAAVIFCIRPTTTKNLRLPMYIYLVCNSLMNLFAFVQMLSLDCIGAKVSFAGAVLFFISDCTLFLVRFYKKDIIPARHFTVMSTYVFGEFLIAHGMVLLAGGM